MTQLDRNILPILCSNYEEGCGFFIGHHFLTSGHVISKCEDPFVEIHGEKIYLNNPSFFQSDEFNANGYDLAIFDIPSYGGNLELFENDIKSGMKLKSLSYKYLGTEFVESEVTTQEQDGNYFCGISKANLKSGSSGSPVLLGNRVVGIMTKGNNNDLDEPIITTLPLNFCMFLSATAIRNVI